MAILITGGLGYIGSHICIHLLNYDIIIIDKQENKITLQSIMQKRANLQTDFYKCDLLLPPEDQENKNILTSIFQSKAIYAVIHCAGLKSVSQSVNLPLLYYHTNITITLNLLNFMQKYGCNKIIFSSSATVYSGSNHTPPFEESMPIIVSNIENAYGKTKYFIEEILRDLCSSNSDWSATVLRYFNPLGTEIKLSATTIPQENNLMPKIINLWKNPASHPPLMIFGGNQTADKTCIRDYIHIYDLAEGHIHALLKKGFNIYNLGTGSGTSVLELLNTFMQTHNLQNFNYLITPNPRPGDAPVLVASINKARQELNPWQIKKSRQEMCKDIIL